MNRGSYLMSLSAVIQEIGNTYIEEKETGEFKGAPVGNLVKHKMVEELRNIEELKNLKLKVVLEMADLLTFHGLL